MRTYNLISIFCIISLIIIVSPASSQEVLFDFNSAPLYNSLPIYQTAGGITAHLTATGQGYSIQNANVLGFTPQGFDGRIIYPNSIFLADLKVSFDHLLTSFSIMYACQELGCDDAATMRVTAYHNGIYVGTNTRTATFPGTWPVDTLRCSFSQGFDSVVVHYDSHPPTCQDYGTIFVADNMRVTPSSLTGLSEGKILENFTLNQNYPNPFNPKTIINYHLAVSSEVKLVIYDLLGKETVQLLNEKQKAGNYNIEWDASSFSSGVYFYTLTAGDYVETKKMILIK